MKIATAQVQIADFQCRWSVAESEGDDAGGGRTLTLAYEIEARSELYVSDRHWKYDPARSAVPDPYGVHRYVRDGSLRLVFATAPMRPNTSLRVTYPPLFSRVLPGELYAREVSIALPVDEYSSVARDVDAPTVLERVSRVVLVMGYRLRATMDRDPIPPLGETPEGLGYVVANPSLFVSSTQVSPLQVRRREGYIPRFTLPGEAPLQPYP